MRPSFLRWLIMILLASPVFAQETTVTFLHYNDFHAHLVPHTSVIRDGDSCNDDPDAKTEIGELGGIARLKTLIDQIRSENQYSVLMNIGDTYHGGVEALYTAGNAIVDPINALGIDVGVPGNWDFGYGPGVFRLRYAGSSAPLPPIIQQTLPASITTIKTPSFPNLAANLAYSKLSSFDPTPDGEQVMPGTYIIQKGNVKIGFIGITSDIVPKMYYGLALGFNFLEGQQNYINLINEKATYLRESQNCNAVVVMSELGIHKDLALATLISPSMVDVFFSAHTHELTYEPITTQSGALVVEAGNDGYLGKMNVSFDTDGKPIDFNWELLPINKSIPEDPEMKQLVDIARAPFLVSDPNMSDPNGGGLSGQELHQPITAVLGSVDKTLTRVDALESVFNNTITDIMRSKASKDLAISPGFRYDSPILAPGLQYEDNTVATGELTIEDVYRYFPVVYTLRQGNVTAGTLKQIVEELLTSVFSTTHFDQEGGWVDGFSGIDVTLNLDNPNNQRVLEMRDSDTGSLLKDTDELSVVGCQRPFDDESIICSHTGFTNTSNFNNPGTGLPWTIIDIFTQEFSTNPQLTVSDRQNFHDVSGEALYPEHPWVQPIRYVDDCTYNPPIGVVTGLSDFNITEGDVHVYPNPTTDVLYVHTDENLLSKVVLSDQSGRALNVDFHNSGSTSELDVSGLSSGIYFLTVFEKQSSKTFQVVKIN